MKVLRHESPLSPYTLLSTNLNAPCSSLILAQPHNSRSSPLYLIVGKVNGETVFFNVGDRMECVWIYKGKHESEPKMPLTLAAGDIRNVGWQEVVTVNTSGFLEILSFPTGSSAGPTAVFSQVMNANICSAQIFDIDEDGHTELVVVMTDRVVRSYRFANENQTLIPLNKWEIPDQISGWSIGLGKPDFALLSQAARNHYVKLEFGVLGDTIVYQSSIKVEDGAPSHLILPPNPLCMNMLHCLVSKVIIAQEKDKEIELKNPGGDIACATTTLIHPGIHILITIDPWGQLFIYAWNADNSIDCTAIGKCQMLSDVDYICAFPGPKELQVVIGIVSFCRVATFCLDLSCCLFLGPDS